MLFEIKLIGNNDLIHSQKLPGTQRFPRPNKTYPNLPRYIETHRD